MTFYRNDATGALLAWVDDAVAGALDWTLEVGGSDATGYVVVNATDSKLPATPQKPSIRSQSFASNAAAAAAATGAVVPPGNTSNTSFSSSQVLPAQPVISHPTPPASQPSTLPSIPSIAATASFSTTFDNDDDGGKNSSLLGATSLAHPSPASPVAALTGVHVQQQSSAVNGGFGGSDSFGDGPAFGGEAPMTHLAAIVSAPFSSSSPSLGFEDGSPFCPPEPPTALPQPHDAPTTSLAASASQGFGFEEEPAFGATSTSPPLAIPTISPPAISVAAPVFATTFD